MLCNKCLAAVLSLAAAVSAPAEPPSTAPASRPATQITEDWQSTSQALRALLPPPRELTTPAARAQAAFSAVPLLRKAQGLTIEMYHADPSLRPTARQHYYHLLAILAFLGDHPAIIELDNARRSGTSSPANAPLARHAWYLTRWWPRINRPADATKLLDELEALAIAKPDDDDLTSLLLQMREDLPLTSPLGARIETLITTHLTGPLAQIATTRFRFAEKRRSLLGKPLLVSAPTVAGQSFSTRQLAGQTVILHFGLTASPQWQTQHNALLQSFADLPAKIAIVTILCDDSDAAVRTYLADHKETPWPVLRDATDPSGFAAQYGVTQFPTTIILAPDGTASAVDVLPDPGLLLDSE